MNAPERRVAGAKLRQRLLGILFVLELLKIVMLGSQKS